MKKQESQDEMRSTPNFDVEIKRGNQILCFNCSFVQNAAEGENQEEFSKFYSKYLLLFKSTFKPMYTV